MDTPARCQSIDKAGSMNEIEETPVIKASETGGRVFNGLLVYSIIVFAMASLLFGFDNGVIGPIVSLPAFIEKFQGLNPVTGTLVFTARNQNLLFSVPLVGTIFGALAGDPLQNKYGRKWSLVGCYIFSIGGVFLQLFAPNLGAFVAGRFWNGIAYGTALAIAPLYLSEITPAIIRGATVQLNSIFTIFSSVIATAVVYGSSQIIGDWSFHIPLIFQAATPIVILPLTFVVPESPLWLVSKDRMEEARHNLRRLRGFSDAEVDDEMRAIAACVEEERALAKSANFWEKELKRTITAGSLFSLNQISGIILSTTYATVFLTQIGAASPFLLTMIAALTQLIGSCAAPFVVDRAGRRPLALVGFTTLLIIDVIAGTLAFFTDRSSAIVTTIAAMSFIFNFVWCLSFYSLSLLMPTEIPTPRLRNATMSYAVACGQTTAVITTFVVPQLVAEDAANLGAKTYLVFAGCMVGIIVFAYFMLPETRHRTFGEIDELYKRGVPMNQWRHAETYTTAKKAKVVTDFDEKVAAARENEHIDVPSTVGESHA